MSESLLDTLTFEQALAEIERLVRELEEGQTGLEESLARYERGVGLLKRCYSQLQQAEQRILLLTGVGVAAFGQQLNASEVAGLALAIGSLVLLMRFA